MVDGVYLSLGTTLVLIEDEPEPVAKPEPEPLPPIAAEGVTGADVLELPAALLVDMPLPSTLVCRAVDGRAFVITAHQPEYEHATVPAFTAGELRRMAAAAELDRAWPHSLGEWLDAKVADPHWRLSTDEACGPGGIERDSDWPIGRVFARLRVSLDGVRVIG